MKPGGVAGAWRRVAAALTLALSTLPAFADGSLPVQEVAPGVHVHVGAVESWGSEHEDVANLGVVVGRRCVAVIDTGGSPEQGRRWLATIRKLTPLPICHVILTHVHPDHLLGSIAFAELDPRPEFIGHRELAAALAARGPYYLRHLEGQDAAIDVSMLVIPDRQVDDRLELDLGDRRLSLRAWPTAHTNTDLSVVDESTGTWFVSDLLFVHHLPVLDGRLRGWAQVTNELRELSQGPAMRRIVPGHGPARVTGSAALEAQQSYLEHLLQSTRAAIREGATLSEAVDRIGVGSTDWQLTSEYHRRNVTAAYAELEWE